MLSLCTSGVSYNSAGGFHPTQLHPTSRVSRKTTAWQSEDFASLPLTIILSLLHLTPLPTVPVSLIETHNCLGLGEIAFGKMEAELTSFTKTLVSSSLER